MRHLYCNTSLIRILITWSSSLLSVQKATIHIASVLLCLHWPFRELQTSFKLELELVCVYFRPSPSFYQMTYTPCTVTKESYPVTESGGVYQEARTNILVKQLNPYLQHFSLAVLMPQLPKHSNRGKKLTTEVPFKHCCAHPGRVLLYSPDYGNKNNILCLTTCVSCNKDTAE